MVDNTLTAADLRVDVISEINNLSNDGGNINITATSPTQILSSGTTINVSHNPATLYQYFWHVNQDYGWELSGADANINLGDYGMRYTAPRDGVYLINTVYDIEPVSAPDGSKAGWCVGRLLLNDTARLEEAVNTTPAEISGPEGVRRTTAQNHLLTLSAGDVLEPLVHNYWANTKCFVSRRHTTMTVIQLK